MKKRVPKISNKKLRGEWAEMCFMLRIAEMGLPISKPWGEMRSFDFVVGRPRHFVAVQVKSTICEMGNGYECTVRGGHECYPPGSFDFLAAYVVLENSWYIIPEEKIWGIESIGLYPNSTKAKYEPYREAWHLLGPTDSSGDRINIQACEEEFSSAWIQ
jgi:PD-(D/E)XK nuclease superfamily protein